MNSHDIEDHIWKSVIAVLLAGLAGVVIFGVSAFSSAVSGTNQSTEDVTAAYSLPAQLSHCRVYRLVPRGFGQTLYVVSSGGTPESVEFEQRNGKTTRKVVVSNE